MAAAIGNPAGYVNVFDGANPRVLTGYAREVISGGCFVFGSMAADTVSSGLNSYVSSDLKIATNASGLWVNGVAIQTAASGAECAFATRGVIIALADGTVTAGAPVIVAGVNGVRDVSTGSLAATEYPVGRALTTTSSGGYCLVHLCL